MLLSIDGTFLVQVLNFILFWVLLNYLFIRPVRRSIDARQQYIAQLYRQADDLAAQAAQARAQAQAILDAARRQTQETMRRAAAEAAAQAHEIERRAAEEAAAAVQLAHATVAAERVAAREKQQAFVEELARSMVRRATGAERAA
jgi:F-type H+-transporting ATPase subunit b